jgi:hypothetical protein
MEGSQGSPLNAEILGIAIRLHTQDNRITESPIFVVQQKVRDCGFEDGYSDKAVWVDDEGEDLSETRSQRLEALHDWGRKYRRKARIPYRRVGIRDRWEFVTACFTEQGCKDYIKVNGHKLKETRIYAETGYRNWEYQAVRKFLMELKGG